jgi:transcriptional repressor NrdR
MRCPGCGDEANRVIDTRDSRDGGEIRRRRQCEECGRRFTTRERIERTLPKVRKRDERREDYDREKLLASIERSCVKRPISADSIDRLVEAIERRIQEFGEKEISSRYLGERAMELLTEIDPLAAVRFASVFHNFQSTEDYAAFFASLAGIRVSSESSEVADSDDNSEAKEAVGVAGDGQGESSPGGKLA